MTVFDRFFGDSKNRKNDSPLSPIPSPSFSPRIDNEAVSTARRYSPGMRIADRYEVVKVLEGGMGLVYLCADHAEQQRPVALKTFKPRYLPDRPTRDRFLREGTIWVGLKHHPHIVSAYRVERLRGGLEMYLVLEWVAAAEGKEDASLRNWLHPGKPLSFEQALQFGLHIARGMKYAVTQIPGLLHRDLKPENILIGRDGYARVTDFGLASVLASSRDLLWNASGNRDRKQGGVGTPHYMAPEQWKPGTPVDARIDIYAFGCILSEMLTGYMAVSGKDIDELARAHRLGWLRELPIIFPPEIKVLIQGCVALDAGKRFANWADVVTAITLVYERVVGKQLPPALEESAQTDARAERIAAAWSYDAMGLSYHDIGNHDLAAGYFERVIWLSKEEKDLTLQGVGLSHLGSACLAMGDLQGALSYHKKHLAITRQTKDVPGESDAIGNLGKVYTAQGDLKQAMACYKRQLLLVQRLGDNVREGLTLNNLGDLNRNSNEFRQALGNYKRALSIVRQTEDRLREGRILGNIGLVYAIQKNSRATEYYDLALNIAQEIGDRTGEGIVLRNMGDLQRDQDNVSKAIWFYINYLAIVQEIGDQAGEKKVLIDLGDIYLREDKEEQAVESYQAALDIARKLADQQGMGRILRHLGYAYFKMGNLDQSIGFYEEALKLLHKLGDQSLVGEVAYSLGNVYRDNNNLQRARQQYEMALATARRTGDERIRANVSYDYAIALALSGEREQALHFAELAAYTFKLLDSPQREKRARDLVNEIQRKRRWF